MLRPNRLHARVKVWVPKLAKCVQIASNWVQKKSQIENTFGVQVLGFGLHNCVNVWEPATVWDSVCHFLWHSVWELVLDFYARSGEEGEATRDGAQLMNGAPRPRSTTEGKTVPRAVGPVWEIPSCGPRVRSWRTVVRGNTRFLATPGQSSWGTFLLSNEERRLRGFCDGASSWLAVRPNLSLCLSSNHGRV